MTNTHIVPTCEEQHKILAESTSYVIVNKPAGLLSVPGRLAENKDCLIHRMYDEYPTALIVHRLDLATSGLLVVALTTEAHRNLSMQFQNRKVEKSYVAVVDGKLEKAVGEINAPIICDWPNRPKQKIDFESGKNSTTSYSLISYNESASESRVELKPVTGRTHQLRIHMQYLGNPILGCRLYAPEEVTKKSNRLLLHAQSLQFTCPDKNIEVTFEDGAEF